VQSVNWAPVRNCPEPGSSAYITGLNYLDNCIQLTIKDGGPNDTDNQVNGVINDPSTVGLTLTEPEGFEEVEEGSGGRVSPLLLRGSGGRKWGTRVAVAAGSIANARWIRILASAKRSQIR